jgi:VanZ family protein
VRSQIYFWTAIAWTSLIFFLCLESSDELPKIKLQNFDKMAHAGIHFVLTTLWFFAFYKKIPKVKNAILKAFLLCF